MPDVKIIAVDFDGTLCEKKYPEIGAPRYDVISTVIKLKAAGNVLILYTCRREEYLTAAVEWCAAHGITFDYINENAPQIIERYGSDTRKISADVYIDDKAINPRRSRGIGENDENIKIYEQAEILAERDLCDIKCVCPEWKAAGMCCQCDVLFSLREYHAEQLFEMTADKPTEQGG